MEQTLAEQKFLAGDEPAYADYIVFSVPRDARPGCPCDLLLYYNIRRWRDAIVARSIGSVTVIPVIRRHKRAGWPMTRRIMIESIRRDPTWHDGDYTVQPPSLLMANVFSGIATSGGALGSQSPTRQRADRLADDRLAAPAPADANDFIWQFDASRDYNPSPGLERIEASVLAINSADDERNPPETGLMEQAPRR